jgi:hypothetical protein
LEPLLIPLKALPPEPPDREEAEGEAEREALGVAPAPRLVAEGDLPPEDMPVEGLAPALPVEGRAPAFPVEGRAPVLPPPPQPRDSRELAEAPLLFIRLWSGCHFFCAPVLEARLPVLEARLPVLEARLPLPEVFRSVVRFELRLTFLLMSTSTSPWPQLQLLARTAPQAMPTPKVTSGAIGL